MASTKQRAILLVHTSIVLATCIFLVSAGIAMLTVPGDPISFVVAIILVPLSALLGVQQYRATFRHNPNAAKKAAIMLFIIAGFAAFMLVTNLGEATLSDIALPTALV